MTEATGAAAAAADSADAATDPVLRELVALVARGEKEGTAILPELRGFFDQHPETWRRIGDLAASARLALVDLAVGGQVVVKEATLRQAAELEADLAGTDPSPLEKVLAGHVAVAWLAAAEAETTAANARAVPLAQAEFLDRRRDRAGRRPESATKAMALVKRLLRPSPAPIEVATRLGGRGARAASRQAAPVSQGVAVEN
jgi:hypothetical protein